MKTFGERLRDTRESKNMSQQAIADILGLHRSNYSKIENNHQKMTHEQLALFCEALNISADYLLNIQIQNKITYTKEVQTEMELKLQELNKLLQNK